MPPDSTLGDLLFKAFTAVLLGVVLSLGGGFAAFAGFGLQIFVSMPSGVVVTLDLESSDSIENVRQKVQDHTGIPPEEQLLSVAGTELEDGFTIADYNIQPNATVTLGYARPLALVTTTFPSFRLDADYTSTIAAAPAFSPLIFALTAGVLPAGVSFDPATATFSGRPTAAGPYAFTITVTRDDGTSLAIPFSGIIASAAAAPAVPGGTLAETGVDPMVPIGLAGMLTLASVVVLRRHPRRA